MKPPKPRSSHRRGFRPDEAALMRHLAWSSKGDPLLDVLVILLAERALLRKEEITSLRVCDIDLDRGLVHVHGKGASRGRSRSRRGCSRSCAATSPTAVLRTCRRTSGRAAPPS